MLAKAVAPFFTDKEKANGSFAPMLQA